MLNLAPVTDSAEAARQFGDRDKCVSYFITEGDCVVWDLTDAAKDHGIDTELSACLALWARRDGPDGYRGGTLDIVLDRGDDKYCGATMQQALPLDTPLQEVERGLLDALEAYLNGHELPPPWELT